VLDLSRLCRDRWPGLADELDPHRSRPRADADRMARRTDRAGCRTSSPITAPKQLNSHPSIQPTVRLTNPASVTKAPVPDGVVPIQRPS
jgi:hypothetical protein